MSYIESKKKRKYPGLAEAEKQRRKQTIDFSKPLNIEREELCKMSYDEYQRWLIYNNID